MKILFSTYREIKGETYRFTYNSGKILLCEKKVFKTRTVRVPCGFGYSVEDEVTETFYERVGQLECENQKMAKEFIEHPACVDLIKQGSK